MSELLLADQLPAGLYQLVTWPDKRLLQVSDACTEADVVELKKMIKPMIAICKEYNGVGLAAVQIGVHKRLCILKTTAVTPDGFPTEDFIPMINPEIVETDDPCVKNEGCLSLPYFNEPTNRFEQITVKYRELDWTERTVVLTGLEAQCIQHEIDHMDGITQNTKVSITKQQMWEKKLAKGRKHGKIRV